MNPFSEVGREINQCQDEIRQIKGSLYRYVEEYKLDSVKNNLAHLEARITNIENDLSWMKEAIQAMQYCKDNKE